MDLTADQRNAHNTEQKGKDKLASDDAASISSYNSICGREGDGFENQTNMPCMVLAVYGAPVY